MDYYLRDEVMAEHAQLLKLLNECKEDIVKANVRPLPESCFKAVNNFLNATCPILGVPDVLRFMIMLDSPFYRLQPKYDELKQKLVNQLWWIRRRDKKTQQSVGNVSQRKMV